MWERERNKRRGEYGAGIALSDFSHVREQRPRLDIVVDELLERRDDLGDPATVTSRTRVVG